MTAPAQTTQRRCPDCSVTASVPAAAAAYKCPGCQQLWLFQQCMTCGVLHTIDPARGTWSCSNCGTVNQPPRGAGAPGAAAGSFNGMAIACFVLSLLWFAGFGSLLAVVFALVALRQITQRGQRGQGLAVAGLVIGILGVISSIIFWLVFALGTAVHNDFRDTCNSLSQQTNVSGTCS